MEKDVLNKNTWYHLSVCGCHCKSISKQENSSNISISVLSVLMPDAGGYIVVLLQLG